MNPQELITKQTNLSISLLVCSPDLNYKINESIRNCGQFTEYYNDITSFWTGIQHQVPDLVFIDILDVFHPDAPLEKHPLVKNGKLRVVLIYNSESSYLLGRISWMEKIYALMNLDTNLDIQIKQILSRYYQDQKEQKRVHLIEQNLLQLHQKKNSRIQDQNKLQFFKHSYDLVGKISEQISETSRLTDFSSALLNVLSSLSFLEQIACYALSPNGQRLISPSFQLPKFLSLPQLFLGQDSANGITPYGEEMAYRVVSEFIPNSPAIIKVKGESSHPDYLVYLKFESDKNLEIDFDLLNKELTRVYREYLLERKFTRNVSSTKSLAPAQMLEEMDAIAFHQNENLKRCIAISFTPFIQFIKNRPKSRFYYHKFFSDFLFAVEHSINDSHCQYSMMGVWSLVLLAPQNELVMMTKKMQLILQTFSYWKYFENQDEMLLKENHPVLMPLSPSSIYFLRHFEKEFIPSSSFTSSKIVPTHLTTN